MIVIEPGHVYIAEGIGGKKGEFANSCEITFVKNRGEKYPGNEGDPHPGIQSQELMRILIDRTLYLNGQGPCMETELALGNLRSALALFELRAARCRGDKIELEHADQLEKMPTCEICGHNFCSRTEEDHERLPGTWR